MISQLRAADVDELEKRVAKEKRKGFALVEKALGVIQYELQMDKSDQTDRMALASSTEDFQYVDYDQEFARLIRDFIIAPFGKTLNQDLHELFTSKLDLSEALVKELKAAAQVDGRKSTRKPVTPTKRSFDAGRDYSQSGKRSASRT